MCLHTTAYTLFLRFGRWHWKGRMERVSTLASWFVLYLRPIHFVCTLDTMRFAFVRVSASAVEQTVTLFLCVDFIEVFCHRMVCDSSACVLLWMSSFAIALKDCVQCAHGTQHFYLFSFRFICFNHNSGLFFFFFCIWRCHRWCRRRRLLMAWPMSKTHAL